jgi:hypothetical protein
MFVAMALDVQANHFVLPATTTYNFEGIPFAYPPLAFYLLAALQSLTHLDVFFLARWLPLLANLGTVALVAVLGRLILKPAWAVILAPIVFGLLPRSYEWMIMGGGLTRSFGYLLAVAGVVQAIRLARAPGIGRALGCGVLGALTLATHLEEGLFALYSMALAVACFGRDARALVAFIGVGVVSAIVSAPWWLTVLTQHGLAPFQAASMTSGWSTPENVLGAVGTFLSPPSVPLAVVGSLAVLGGVLCALRGEFFLPVWLVAIFLLTPRSGPSEGVLPLAMLASIVLVEMVAPATLGAIRQNPIMLAVQRLQASPRVAWSRTPDAHLLGSTLAIAALLLGVYRLWPQLPLDRFSLDSLPSGERDAMAWVASNTPPDAQVLVLSATRSWEEDMVGEWFPLLAQRHSVLTPQGAEWLPDEMHNRRVCLFGQVRNVPTWDHDLTDLDLWASLRGVSYSYIYISHAARGPVDWSRMLESAETSSNYNVVLETPAATVLARQTPVVARWSESDGLDVARDCQSLADQPPPTRADFEGRYGERAATAWVAEHEEAIPGRPGLVSLATRAWSMVIGLTAG